MPMLVKAETRRMDQEEFGKLAYAVMDCIFGIHNEMGRFLREQIYRDEIAFRFSNVQTEVEVEVRFDDFCKSYFMDLLVDGGAPLELKAEETLANRHRAQLLNYLLLAELSRGKLVNLRPELVEHEFVNTTLTRADRTRFAVIDRDWKETQTDGQPLKPWVVSMLRDWGAGLDIHLYEEAVTHFLGGDERVIGEVEIWVNDRHVGSQKTRLICPGWAFKITAIDENDRPVFEDHMRRFLRHTHLQGVQWINIRRDFVTFSTIERTRNG